MTEKQTLNIEWIYKNLVSYVEMDDDLNVKTINCLNYYKRLQEMSTQKTFEEVEKQFKMFRIFTNKMYEIFESIPGSNQVTKSIGEIKSKMELRKVQIQDKLISFNVKKEATAPKKQGMKKQASNQHDDDLVEKLLQEVQYLNQGGMRMSKSLSHSQQIVEGAKSNQEQVLQMLGKVDKLITGMLYNPSLGWIKLIIMSLIAALLFLFTAMFILAF